jgi:hypothetical protein
MQTGSLRLKHEGSRDDREGPMAQASGNYRDALDQKTAEPCWLQGEDSRAQVAYNRVAIIRILSTT